MHFRPIHRSHASGTSLWFVLENATNEQVREYFGDGFEDEDNEKYSSTHVFQSLSTNCVYTLYKKYGVWRVGGGERKHIDDELEFRKMFNDELVI